jgi:hypothetical protein
MPVMMAGDHQLWKYTNEDALKRIMVLKMRNPKEGAVGKQQCHTGSMKNESWTLSKPEKEALGPVCSAICKGNHRCHRQTPLV